ncbi:SEL1-like repeat protein [Rhizobium cremeum]|uniref:peptidoglycan-binding protein n=1 Tax=Rhizobium cremeum TaxID=2813827 RepID=UPI001FD0642A|nr:peptidoglycan-binding protein [Rhizobium cremeum]MCJ7994954.1 SEL1-like repeat protein [Rhizobium cremeum]MCJ8000734.1 SEL1-like repeat protein [Rhizobium cremeum]
MNGSRSTSSRPGGSSSLDALSRTIEGLEARIEGLMGTTSSRGRLAEDIAREAYRERGDDRYARPAREASTDPLAEIRQRQRALEDSRQRPAERTTAGYGRAYDPQEDRPRQAPFRQNPPSPYGAASAVASPDTMTREITQALLGLRQELKQDISESLSREVGTLRAEMRSIRALAEDQRPSEALRNDIARLAESIQHLSLSRAPGADGLREEFEELRSLMDGLAREDSVRRMDNRWSHIEEKISDVDPAAMREELVLLADRLDDIKSHIGRTGDNRALHALEDKLMKVATALEQIGSHIDPSERMMSEQFAGIDMRLDEISRAIVAGARNSGGPDNGFFQRLEDRIAGLAHQIEAFANRRATEEQPASDLARRIESLTGRIEQLSEARTASHLEERLDMLSHMLERTQAPVPQPELTGYLADISRKIDALDHGAVNDRLADRLELLARRIEGLEVPQPAVVARIDDSLLRGLEDRLNAVVDRIEENAGVPAGESASLRGLEEQIAHLSTLIARPSTGGGIDDAVAERISALEDYMATSDEYIIEAARQAAETVMESYAQRLPAQGAAGSADIAALSALSEHLRNLEDFSRNSEERTHRTFEALHDTLVQIANRLDQIDDRTAHFEEPQVPFRQPSQSVETPSMAEEPSIRAPLASHAMETADTGRNDVPHIEAPAVEATMTALPVIEAARSDRKPGKPSLLAGLGKRLLPGQKKNEEPVAGRQVIDPTPSIDPSDMLPPEQANELLEPGSGAPDVRKILERVRASQAKNESGAPAGEADRADYIAAARRAAQAAAQEMDLSQKSVRGAKPGAAALTGFARYRRPILMAVGAILLAAMAMPLVTTLIRGEKAPPVVIETPKPQESGMAPATAPVEERPETNVAAAIAPPASEATGASEPVPAAPVARVEQAPLDSGDALSTLQPATEDSQQDSAAFAPATGEAQTAETTDNTPVQPPQSETAPAVAIVVPDAISPPSLAIAAKEGDPIALFEIGARYTEGRGVASDFAEAAKWYQLSADRGFVPAQYRLANLYEKGTGVSRDIAKAKSLYQQAAEAGNASAMHNLAVLFASGADGGQDYAKAVEWFSKAAEYGVSDSQFNLAILYARGNGVQQDLEASYKWFAIAARDGDKDAAQKRDEVANAMRPEQLERARAQVDLWKPKPLDPDANTANTPDEWAGKGLKTASVDMKKAIRNIQAILNKNGFDAGTPDGMMGAKTTAAIKAFQTSIGEQPTGQVTDKLVNALLERNK